jgi:hypothetical protein
MTDWWRKPRKWNIPLTYEPKIAVARGLRIYAATDGHPIPSVEAHQLCPHYRVVHYEISDRDTCDATVSRCPTGANCPLREKVWRGRAR